MDKNQINSTQEGNGEREELDLIDILDFFAENAATIVIFLIIGIASSLAIYRYLPYKWDADITLKIGKVPFQNRLDYIAPPVEVVENIKSPLFLSKLISLMYGKDVSPDSPSAKLLYKDMKVSLIKGTDLLNVRVSGWSSAEAYKNVGILADSVIAEHREMEQHYLIDTNKQLSLIVSELERAHRVLANVETMEERAPSKTEANTLLKLALIDAKNGEIQKLQIERTQLESLLSAARLQETRVVGRSLPPAAPSSPRLGLLVLGGACLGLMAGLLFSLGRLVHRRGIRSLLAST